jgi:polyhydroxyalkanoate synthase
MSEYENQAARFAREVAANTQKVFKATRLIANTRDEEVNVGTTPKHLVMRRDKVELFRYEPLAQQTVSTPVLVAYGLVGRYTMADLQPDRSLMRSLLNKGLDLWLIDWGQPGRNERWLTIDDYVDDYRPYSQGNRARPRHAAWNLRRRRIHCVLCRTASGESEESRHHDHADRLPC